MAVRIDSVHSGHRTRMRERLLQHGTDVFDSHELLEMLLYYRIPYRDTNPVAHRLLSVFGSFDRMFRATAADIAARGEVTRETAEFLLNAVRCAEDGLYYREPEYIFDDFRKTGSFLLTYFRAHDVPRVVVLFLNNKNGFLSVDVFPTEGCSLIGQKPQKIVAAALTHGAASVIVAHNHPHGPAFPTPSDRAADTALRDALSQAGIQLLEHYIFCGDEFSSVSHSGALVFRQTATPFDVQSDLPASEAYLRRMLSPACRPGKLDAAVDALMQMYGCSPSRVLSGDIRRLSACPEVGLNLAVYIKLITAVAARRITDAFRFGLPHTEAEVREYLTYLFVGDSVESIYLLMFDKSMRAVAAERVSVGAVNSSEVNARRMLEVMTNRGAVCAVIAHNHPGGTTAPSDADLRVTETLHSAFRAAGFRLLAHYIVAGMTIAPLNNRPTDSLRRQYPLTFSEN